MSIAHVSKRNDYLISHAFLNTVRYANVLHTCAYGHVIFCFICLSSLSIRLVLLIAMVFKCCLS